MLVTVFVRYRSDRLPIGAHNRIRTDDLFLTKEVLYHLSYVSAGSLVDPIGPYYGPYTSFT